MRVIAGKFKGRKLICPPGLSVRPTSDPAKETIFNLLGGRVEGAQALDLFAGVGALGIEALSRGAREVVFVERDGKAVEYIFRNLESAGIGEEAAVLKGDVFSCVRKLSAKGRRYDLVFIDPPYGEGLVSRFLSLLERHPLLGEGASLVIQHHAKEDVGENASRLALDRRRNIGDTVITLLVAV